MRRMPDRGGARWSLFVTLRMGERECFVAGGSGCCRSVEGEGGNSSIGVVDVVNVVIGVVDGVVISIIGVVAGVGVTGDGVGVIDDGVGVLAATYDQYSSPQSSSNSSPAFMLRVVNMRIQRRPVVEHVLVLYPAAKRMLILHKKYSI